MIYIETLPLITQLHFRSNTLKVLCLGGH